MGKRHTRIIGVTGGVGCGKSEILSYLKKTYKCRVLLADLVAKQMQEPGSACYGELVSLLGRDVLDEMGNIQKDKMAEKIFQDGTLLKQVNDLIHPAVVTYILQQIEETRKSGEYDFFLIEAALLIETGFDKICDELWYIYAKEEVRRARLKASRGYRDEKITAIMGKQLPEETFRKYCKVVIDNSDTLEKSFDQIDRVLEAYL